MVKAWLYTLSFSSLSWAIDKIKKLRGKIKFKFTSEEQHILRIVEEKIKELAPSTSKSFTEERDMVNYFVLIKHLKYWKLCSQWASFTSTEPL